MSKLRLRRALRAMRSNDGAVSRILLGAVTDGERFELRKQQLLRGTWGANSRHGHVAICSGFELDAAFDAEVMELLLHGYELDGSLNSDELAVLSEDGSAEPVTVSGDLALPTWPPQQWRSIAPAAATARAVGNGKLLARNAPPPGTRMLLQLPDGGGLPRLVNAGSPRAPWEAMTERWRGEWVGLLKRLATTGRRDAPHMLIDTVLPKAGQPICAVDLLAYDWRDVRPMDADERLRLLEQGVAELDLPREEIVPLPRAHALRVATGHIALIGFDAPYHSPLLIGGGGF